MYIYCNVCHFRTCIGCRMETHNHINLDHHYCFGCRTYSEHDAHTDFNIYHTPFDLNDQEKKNFHISTDIKYLEELKKDNKLNGDKNNIYIVYREKTKLYYFI